LPGITVVRHGQLDPGRADPQFAAGGRAHHQRAVGFRLVDVLNSGPSGSGGRPSPGTNPAIVTGLPSFDSLPETH
jgi:hypothetical protein